MIVVAGDHVSVQDLESRNGVLVNGHKISAVTTIRAGDKILIGSQELTLLGGKVPNARDTVSLAASTGTLPRIQAVADIGIERPDARDRTDAAVDDQNNEDSTMVRRVTAFKLLGGVAEKALAMGRVDEAERLLAGPLADVIEASRGGKPVSPWIVDIAARLAAKLATATTKGSWADYVIEVYYTQKRLCPAPVADELEYASRKVNAIDLYVSAYLAHLREKAATSPAPAGASCSDPGPERPASAC